MDIKKLIRSRKFFFTLVALIGLGYYRYQATEGIIAHRASRKINVSRDEHSISEIGYVYEMRVKTDWWQRTQSVIWWVKVPATNKIWSCSLEGGYNDFEKDDAVSLVREDNADDSEDHYGYIVGLHGKKKDKTSLVWAIDNDDLE